MRRIGIIAALSGELKPLVKGWQQRGRFYLGRLGDAECIAVAGGMGAAAAIRVCEALFAEGKPDTLVSYGWAGSLSCGIKPPSACVIRDVIDSGTGERFVTALSEGHTLITLDHVARPDEKRDLAQKYQAPLVDMEAATIARIAVSEHMEFYCLKGVSDGANDKLPDFNRFLGPDGQLQMPALVSYAVLHPKYWAPLKQLSAQSKSAADNLAVLATESLGKRL